MLEAVLLVGGLGTRLRPLTLTTPKPMLPVAGVPFIAYQFAKLRAAGVEHVVLATSYRPQIFSEYFGDGSDQRLRITYVHEQQPLGTGGAIRNAAAALTGGQDEPIIVLNGDVLSGHDLRGQLLLHQESEAVVTLHLVEVDDARAYGCVPTTPDGQVTGFLEKMPEPVTQWINGGAYVFRRSAVDEIPAGLVVSVERDTFPELLANGAHIHSWKERAYW
ncbi:MAG: nucleotidyltransferase family protein, partial [Candidatus Nanopelagicales bacterium]